VDIPDSILSANVNPAASELPNVDGREDMEIETSANEPYETTMATETPGGTSILLAGTGSSGPINGLGSSMPRPMAPTTTPTTSAERVNQLAREAEWYPTTDWTAWRTSPLPNEDGHDTDGSSPPSLESNSVSAQPTEENSIEQPEDPTGNQRRRPRIYPEDDYFIITTPPPRSYHQQRFEVEMRKTLSRLLIQYLPLTSMRFGSRTSPRPLNKFNRLREAVPRHIFVRFFREYRSYSGLADSLCSIRDGQRKLSNRWQPYLPCIRRIRELIIEYIENAERLLETHGYIDGLKEYAVEHHLDSWEDEQHTGGIFYLHELQYLHSLRRFLVAEEYSDLAIQTQQLLQGAPEHPNDLWALVYTIFECLVPPSYEYQLDCNFEPRTDDIANCKQAHIAKHGCLAGFRPPH